jgi:CHAD domain-containing protein
MPKKGRPSWRGDRSVAENARRELPLLLETYFAEGRRLLAGDFSDKQMHKFRLAGKRLRYTLELFRPLYGPGLERCLAALREVQTNLGNANDLVTTRAMLEHKFPRKSVERSRILAALDKQSSAELEKFKHFWREQFDAAGSEQHWKDYLAHFAGRRKSQR